MIKEFGFYHGAVLLGLVHSGVPILIQTYQVESNASYILNGAVGLYIKYSTKRMTPWRFSFHENHQAEIQELKCKFKAVFLVLVCHDDGIVTINSEELKEILDERQDTGQWVAVSRRPREKYAVSGSGGKLRYKIGESDFPNKILESLPSSS